MCKGEFSHIFFAQDKYNKGVIVDDPRTRVQAECILALFEKLRALQRVYEG